MNPFILYIFLTSIGLGTLITSASSHWLLAWIGLEINMLAILPLMSQMHHPRATEATIKYFLIQSAATVLLLFTVVSNMWISNTYLINAPLQTSLAHMTIIALGMKMGLAPLHAWLPEVMQGVTLPVGLILATFQKIAPMILIFQVSKTDSNMIDILGVLSILTGAWGGLNQTQMRKMLAYSSIGHTGWMMIVVNYSKATSILVMTTYIIMTTTLFLVFMLTSTKKMNQVASSWSKCPIMAAILMVTLLSLSGLPPLTGFMPKILVLQELSKQGMILIAIIAVTGALLSLFFYLRICYITALTISPNVNNTKTPWRVKEGKTTIILPITAMLSTTMLPVTPLFTAIFM
uniref:NADH-ubiquinone oxidoreductase chain 2 n=1 Tax=Muraenesox cinereus TaxID=7946 RepID=A0A7S7BJL0_MURCI|nr:NADH dehydrogenase subunit 2 [Muraenesox cinereus]